MNCPGCQNAIPSNIIFCAYCGVRVYPLQVPRRSRRGRNAFLAGVFVIAVLVGVFYLWNEEIIGQQFPSAPPPTVSPTVAATPVPAAPATQPDAEGMPSLSDAPAEAPDLAPVPTPTPAVTNVPTPTAEVIPTPAPTATSVPTPALAAPPPEIWLVPDAGRPGAIVSLYGRGFQPFDGVSWVTLDGLDLTPSPQPTISPDGQLYANLVVPAGRAGNVPVEVRVGNEVVFTAMEVLPAPTPTAAPTPTPTATPTATPVPLPTPEPWVRQPFGHDDVQYYVTLPASWRDSSDFYQFEDATGVIKVALLARPFAGTPSGWAGNQTDARARFVHSGSLREIGVPLAGSHFIQRFSSDQFCSGKSGQLIRESVLALDFRGAQQVGIAVHVDICQADLDDETERMSREIVSSLRIN